MTLKILLFLPPRVCVKKGLPLLLINNRITRIIKIGETINRISNAERKSKNGFTVTTNKSTYTAKIVVVAVGYTNLININGLEPFIEPHPRAAAEKDRVWLKNTDHLIETNLYVAGTLAGWRSQFAIASGSGAHVATDILTLWNNGKHVKVHDKVL